MLLPKSSVSPACVPFAGCPSDTRDPVVVSVRSAWTSTPAFWTLDQWIIPGSEGRASLVLPGGERGQSARGGDWKGVESLTIGGEPDAVIYDESRKMASIPSAEGGTLAVEVWRSGRRTQLIPAMTNRLVPRIRHGREEQVVSQRKSYCTLAPIIRGAVRLALPHAWYGSTHLFSLVRLVPRRPYDRRNRPCHGTCSRGVRSRAVQASSGARNWLPR